jgi:hypothetical protein
LNDAFRIEQEEIIENLRAEGNKSHDMNLWMFRALVGLSLLL